MDIYNIPGDTGGRWRLDKFVAYHALGDADMNFPLLARYVEESESISTTSDIIRFCYLYSCCYCVPTTIVLYEADLFRKTSKQLNSFWELNKPKLIFQSDKRYVKHMDKFVQLIKEFKEKTQGNPYKYFQQFRDEDHEKTYDNLYRELNKWFYFGRFTTFLMIEALTKLVEPFSHVDTCDFEWNKGNTATSGMLHLLYMDEMANEFDAGASLPPDVVSKLNEKLVVLKGKILRSYPEASIKLVDIETSLCGFRKLFKQSRYGGYYFDRVQEEILHFENHYREYSVIWSQLWRYRYETMNRKLLGEEQGWVGIRKNLNSQWVEKGLTGVEGICTD